jgi:5-methylcytosine-specific restriction endonuclease McrA
MCYPCIRKYNNDYYQKTKERRCVRKRETVASRRKNNLLKKCAYLKSKKCAICGESDPIVLEFDHLHEKRNSISMMLSYSWESIVKEIGKCQILCANCHRRKTYNERGLTHHNT